MRPLILILFMSILGGCVGYRISHVTGTIGGTNVQTPYGPAVGNFQYDATTCFGNCPKPEKVHANTRPAVNSTN